MTILPYTSHGAKEATAFEISEETVDSLASSIIIPIYNEKGIIRQTITRLLHTMDEAKIPYEVVLVDDGSTDHGLEEVDDLPVKVVRHQMNYGYGAALKSGLLHSQYPIVVITDADGTYPIERIPDLIRQMHHHDMVVGARIGQKVSVPLIRRPAKWIIGSLASYLAGQPIPDLNSGLRAMRRSVVMRFLSLLPDGFSFTSTITLAMITNKYRVRYEPIDYHQRHGRSKIRPIYDTINFVQLIIRVVAYFHPLKVFVPLSLILLVGCVIAFIYRLIVGEGMAIVITLLFVSAIQLLGVGLLADLIARNHISIHRASHTQASIVKESEEVSDA